MPTPVRATTHGTHRSPPRVLLVVRMLIVGALLFWFLLGIRGIVVASEALGYGVVGDLIQACSNPFLGLAIGVFGTAVLQSSSVTTTLIVATVSAPDSPLSVAAAIPMVMGANIGTTVISLWVALVHVGRSGEFERALAAAGSHHFFNVLSVAVAFPLELSTGFIEKSSRYLAAGVADLGVSSGLPNPVKGLTDGCVLPLQGLLLGWMPSHATAEAALLVVSGLSVYTSLTLLSRLLRRATQGRVETTLMRSLEGRPLLGVVAGFLVTLMVQASAITTSVLVSLAASRLVTLQQVFPLVVGANVGTTVTATLAALAVSGAAAGYGFQIAAAHVLFNLMGALVFVTHDRTRQLPLRLAASLASFSSRKKRLAFGYVLVFFYVLPLLLFSVFR